MKEYKVINHGDYYVVRYDNFDRGYGSDRKYRTYEQAVDDIYRYYEKIKTVDYESKSDREARKKAEKRNNRIDQILG